LHRFALLTAMATLALIGLGGLVTSHGVGMAVPDWPTTYGYNMFLFPVSQWVGGIFYEHTHRLLASGVGIMTSVLALWLYGYRARVFMRWTGLILLLAAVSWLGEHGRAEDGLILGLTGLGLFGASFYWPSCEPSPKWLRHLGLAAFFAVVLQGVLGGLRVVLFKDQLGIFHACLAQLFFILLCAIALFTSPWWRQRVTSGEWRLSGDERRWPLDSRRSTPVLLLCGTVLIFGQLILGATMRHQHAGLAIPDFPTAYGALWPAMDPASVAAYNQHRSEIIETNPITAFQIGLQMAHRFLAVMILGGVAACAWRTRRQLGSGHVLSKLALGWLGLILAQVVLGAATIWSNKAADIATLHVIIGALSLAAGALSTIIALGALVTVRAKVISAPSTLGAPASLPAVPQTDPIPGLEPSTLRP
jgi:cytochrome c oxidase assembly protein subunit 15